MTRRLRTLLLLAGAVLCSGGAVSQVSDREIARRVIEAVTSYPYYTVFDSIDVRVNNRTVVVGGWVTSPKKKDDLERRVATIDGIRSFTNTITVLPVSPADDRLRYRVAQAIYGHPMFWIYAQMPDPPIHIVVERGRITLTGIADSEVQRSLAATLAQVSGSFGVTNLIRIERR